MSKKKKNPMCPRKQLLIWNRGGKLNDLYDRIPKPYFDRTDIGFEYGEWVVRYYDSVDIGIGFETFVSGGEPIHKNHKVAYRMIYNGLRLQRKKQRKS